MRRYLLLVEIPDNYLEYYKESFINENELDAIKIIASRLDELKDSNCNTNDETILFFTYTGNVIKFGELSSFLQKTPYLDFNEIKIIESISIREIGECNFLYGDLK